jgi:hypothetical protein
MARDEGSLRMPRSDTREIARTLLKLYGRTFAEDLGIPAMENQPSPLFCLLISALLFSTRISHNIALKSARILFERGWTTPESMARSTWAQRVQALDEGGYVRYDERNSTMLGETAHTVIDLYQGDLRRLRAAAEADPARERKLRWSLRIILNLQMTTRPIEMFEMAHSSTTYTDSCVGPESAKMKLLANSRINQRRRIPAGGGRPWP